MHQGIRLSTDVSGDFVANVYVPVISATGNVVEATTAGGLSATASFSSSIPPVSGSTASVQELKLGANLVRVWGRDDETLSWKFFDPRPAFAAAYTLGEMNPGKLYWFVTTDAQSVVLNGKQRTLSAGWNLITW